MSSIQKPLAQSLEDRGVYTLANDTVIEWFEAFIRSFRRTNPIFPLTVIPYNQNIARVRALQSRYSFELMDEAVCAHYDTLAAKVKIVKKEAGCFRKFACFFGKYREFLFLDADIVTLIPVDALFDAFSGDSAEFVHFDARMDMCYKPNLAASMLPEYGSPAYNSGVFFSRCGLLEEEKLFAIAKDATAICDGFVNIAEQSFLNYVTDVSRLKYKRMDLVMPTIAPFLWVGETFVYNWDMDQAKDAEGKIMPLVHWAGCAYPTMLKPKIFLRYRTSDLFWLIRVQYKIGFYAQRYWIFLLRKKARWKKVLIQFFASKSWRKFYLYKMIGIKIPLPK